MALDTRNKRSSAIDIGSPWRAEMPTPDGTINAADRQHAAFQYAGILADNPAPPAPAADRMQGMMKNIGRLMGN